MTTLEKTYSIFAICFATGLMFLLVAKPELRQLKVLLPASGIGLFVNVILMFIVFRDIFYRPQLSKQAKILWTAGLLLFWPVILVYLPLHGFRNRKVML
jgi:hypothetical protein